MSDASPAPLWLTFHHEAMATEFSIAVAGQSSDYARQAAGAAWRELDRLEGELSRYVESSDIARANRLARGDVITIGEDAMRCLLIAAEVSEKTGRAFDPAYASVRSGDQDGTAALFALDPEGHLLTSLTERLHLDLGAVGKGYALDVMADVLREWEITAACLQSGGSTALALEPPAGTRGWPVGLGGRTIMLVRRALSGSGITVKGEHLIDPRTGHTAQRHERAWAFAPGGAVADALSTAFFVMADAEVASFFGSTVGPDLVSGPLPTDVPARTQGPALHKIGAVLAMPDGTLAGYGALPPDFSSAIKTTPGRNPM